MLPFLEKVLAWSFGFLVAAGFGVALVFRFRRELPDWRAAFRPAGPRQVSPRDPRGVRRARNMLRLLMSAPLAILIAWVASSRAAGPELWLIGLASLTLVGLWLPWQPARLAAAALALLTVGSGAFFGLLLVSGGPDSRGPPAEAFPILCILLVAVCLPIALFVVCELMLRDSIQ
jgi:hypothetical protein